MATKKLIVELTTIGGDKVKVDLTKVGEEGQRAMQRILDSTKPANQGLKAIDESVSHLKGKFQGLASEAGAFGTVATKVGGAGLAIGALGGAATLAVAGFVGATRSAIEYAGALQDAADQTQVTAETLQVLRFAAAQAGVDQGKLDSALVKYATTVGEAKEGTGALVAALKDKNAALLEDIRNTKTQEEAIDLLADALAKEKDGTAAAALAKAALGREGARLLPVLREGADGLKRFGDEARSLGGVLSNEMVAKADIAGDKLDALATIIKVNLLRAVLDAGPDFDTLAKAITNVTDKAVAFINFFRDPSKVAVGQGLAAIDAEIQRVGEHLQAVINRPADDPDREGAAQAIVERLHYLEEERQKLVDLQAEKAKTSAAESTERRKTIAEIEAEKKARKDAASEAKRDATEQAQNLAQLQQIQDAAAKQGITATAKIAEERKQALAKIAEIEKESPKLAEQAAKARIAVEEGTQRKLTDLAEEGAQKRQDLEEKVQNIFAENEAKLTEIGATESEKRRAAFEEEKRKQLEAVRELYQDQIDAAQKNGTDYQDLLTAQTDAVKHAAEQQDAIWTKAEQHRHDAMLNINAEIVNGLNGVITGILQGTRDGEQILDAFKDVGIGILGQIFTKTLENKLAFDDEFKVNFLTDLPGLVQHGADAMLGIFGNLFDAILGQKAGTIDAAFKGLFGVAGSAGSAASGSGALGAASSASSGGSLISKALAGLGLGGAATTAIPIVDSAGNVVGLVAANGTVTSGLAGIASIPTLTSGGTLIPGGGAVAVPATYPGAVGGSAVSSTISSYVPYAVIAAIATIVGNQLQKSGSPQVQGLGRGLSSAGQPISSSSFQHPFTGKALGDLGETLLLGGPGGKAIANALGFSIFGGGLSGGQQSRRAIGGTLGGLTSVSQLNPSFDPYKTGLTSIEKAAAAYPELFAKAGNAAKAFGTVFAASVKSGQGDAKEFNFIVETLIDNLGKAGKDGPEGVIRTSAAFRELGITAEEAGQIIQQEFDAGRISSEQYEASIRGLGDVSRVTTAQMVATLKSGLNEQASGVFERMVGIGLDAFDSVTAAGQESWVAIAGSMQNDLLPRALSIYQTLVSMGFSSAEAISRAFQQAFNFEIPEGTIPGGASSPTAAGWFVGDSGRIVFGSRDSGGHFNPASAPETTPEQQGEIRGTAPRIPGFAEGGIVPGPRGMPLLATVHGGEAVLTSSELSTLRGSLAELSASVRGMKRRGGGAGEVQVLPVAFEDEVFKRFYRGRKEGRYIEGSPTQPDKPMGIR